MHSSSQQSIYFLIRLTLFFEFNSIPLQSLWFDTLHIALSYGIRSIASGNLLLIFWSTKYHIRTQENIFSCSREFSFSNQSSTNFPHDFFQNLLFSTWRTSMSNLIPGMPKIVNNNPKNQTTKQKVKRFPSLTFTAKMQNIITNNKRLLNSAPEHAEFPNSGAKTTLKEEMITCLHTTMTETTPHLTLIAHFKLPFPCKKPIFHSKPHNKSMLRNCKGKPNHFPPNSFISLFFKSLPSFRADIRTPLRGSPYWFITSPQFNFRESSLYPNYII
jgi:hypothetical protein